MKGRVIRLLGPKGERRLRDARDYCEFVRSTITADGIAVALGISNNSANYYLRRLNEAGLVSPARKISDRTRGQRRTLWEWKGA